MGREAEGRALWDGQDGAVRALLESDTLILRGGVKARLARAGLAGWRAEGDALHLTADGRPLVLHLPAGEAARWVKALDRPLPTLAEKLGLAPGMPVAVLGDAPPEVAAALAGCAAVPLAGAAMVIAVLAAPEDLMAVLAAGAGVPVWCIHGKGKAAGVGEAAVRAAFRDAGWIDTKTSAVSAAWTATLYRPRRG